MGELKLSSKYGSTLAGWFDSSEVERFHLLLSGHTAPCRQNTKTMVVFRRQIDLTLFTAEIGFQINTDVAIAISMICMLD